MRWFLSLFAAYRAQAETIQSLSTDKLLLQDRLDAVMNDRAELWRMMEKAIDNERATLQSQINYETQRRFGVAQYPEAAQADSELMQGAPNPVSRRQMPSELIANGTQRFMREYLERAQNLKSGPVEEVKD